ncbi:MAG TPA: LuxR C-terminal-related transcriptional regulator [Trebonia sp.]|nr:LuxR C-terminal-related transcriptional regulator [Trebonia sp.]
MVKGSVISPGPDPYQPSSFVGRERELDELRVVVPATRLVTLTGPGGIGKTRLALGIITALAPVLPSGTSLSNDTGSSNDTAVPGVPAFPGGARFVELADLNHPDMVVPRIATTLGVTEEQGRPLLDTVADALRSGTLLVLDNCEHLIDACARACQRMLATSRELHIVATSREPLRVAGEAVWPVPPLSVAAVPAHASVPAQASEAVRLFTERALAASPAFTVAPATVRKITEICRALDGIPLAIELAAARVRTLSVDQIGGRLTDRFGLLTTGDRTAPERQRTLRGAIDWSHGLLTGPEQVLLRRLAVFAGWSLEMAEQVCPDAGPGGIGAADLLDLLSALVDKSLVVREPDALGQARYRLLDTIRQYAAGKLGEAGETAEYQRRLREYVLALVERNYAVGMALVPATWAERVDVFRRYDVDASNLWQALNQCLADGDIETGLRMCTAVRPVWLARGEYRLGGGWMEGFLGAPGGDRVPPGIRGAALVGRAQHLLASDPIAAEPLASEGLRLARDAGDDYWTAAALNVLAEIAVHTARIDEADSLAREALDIAKAAGDTWGEGYSHGVLAAVAALRLNLGLARELAHMSIAIMRSIDHAWGAARAQVGLADLALLQGEHEDARQRYAEAVGIFREIDASPEIARCLVGLARIAMSLGDAVMARDYLTQSIQLSRQTGARIGVARGLEAFAALALAEGDPGRAVVLVAAATALREHGGLPALPPERAERYLAPARALGADVVAAGWARGRQLSSNAAMELAISPSPPPAQPPALSPAVPAVIPPQPSAGPLSDREQQIARLIAKGRSNKEIAQELYISPATAARHIANIMRKLNVHTRTEIAMWTTSPPRPDSALGAP